MDRKVLKRIGGELQEMSQKVSDIKEFMVSSTQPYIINNELTRDQVYNRLDHVHDVLIELWSDLYAEANKK